jgi:hypothetical protein
MTSALFLFVLAASVPPVAPPPSAIPPAVPPAHDSCATPLVVVGTGTFPFDNSMATTGVEGQAEAPCNLTGAGTAILYDLWYTWTATGTGMARFNTCVANQIDTKVAVYPGAGCPTSAAIACNDDVCGAPYASTVTWPATAGQTYTIQLGCYPGTAPMAVPGASTFVLEIVGPPSNDDCTTPIAISGYGVTAFDNALATTGAQGQSEALCNLAGGTAIQRDVWYAWTSPATSMARVRTCGSLLDTKIAIYAGSGCPTGSAIACDDNACQLQSTVDFPTVAGAVYTIQMGLFQGATAGGTSSFEIVDANPPANDRCATPTAIAGPGPHPFDTTFATTGNQGQSEALCSFFGVTSVRNDVWFTWTAPSTSTVTLTTCGGIGVGSSEDTKVAVYAGSGCPATPAIACNEDDGTCGVFGFPSTVSWIAQQGTTYTIQVGRYPLETSAVFGTFTITPSSAGSAYCFGDGSGTPCPCGNGGASGNGCASSVNASGANLSATGSATIASDTLVLRGSGMPNSSALYFQGTTRISPAFGDGIRCAGGAVIRLGTKSNVAGASTYPSGADATVSVRGLVAAGNVRDYQCWYRNAAAFCSPSTFNLTNGLEVAWGP